jgi:putative DNA methylase
LSTKKGKEAHVVPVVEDRAVRFEVRHGLDAPGGTVDRRGARCVVCGTAVPLSYVRAEGATKRMGTAMIAVVTEADRGRSYLAPAADDEAIAASPVISEDVLSSYLPEKALGFRVQAWRRFVFPESHEQIELPKSVKRECARPR